MHNGYAFQEIAFKKLQSEDGKTGHFLKRVIVEVIDA